MAGDGFDRDLPLSGGNRIPAAELVEQASRSGGPGGQHVNTSSTRVSLRWNVRESCGLEDGARSRVLARLASRLTRSGEIVVHVDTHRSRHRNRQAARERLHALVEAALEVPTLRRATRPTRASQTRRLDAKRKRGESKQRRVRRRDDD